MLKFNKNNYNVEVCSIDDISIRFRAFRDIKYCASPVDSIQKMNIFVPESYYEGGIINGYSLKTAPIFMPNTVGGYMPGPVDEPGKDFKDRINSIFRALQHGYIVVSVGVRGRTSGMISNEFFVGSKIENVGSETGEMIGRAPALVVDMKAAIRYLRYNKEDIPGNTEYIITNGTSAGGALSAIVGSSGNNKDYEIYLNEIGALDERDDIFAASCYCPIHNLENSDSAYEWQFCGRNDYYYIKRIRVEDGIKRELAEGVLTEKQRKISEELKQLFPSYVNSLNLKNCSNDRLVLDDNGEGTFKEYMKQIIIASAQDALNMYNENKGYNDNSITESKINKQEYLSIEDGKVIDIDWNGFINRITRMKVAPAFDSLELSSPENEEFGTELIKAQHFTAYAAENSEVEGKLAREETIKLLNPTKYIGNSDTAKHWRIRHGSFDRDTSLAIPAILSLILENNGIDVDFKLPWGVPHSGDYDLDELFKWIDNICLKDTLSRA